MAKLLLALVLTLANAGAFAQARRYVSQIPCVQARGLVDQLGAVVLYSGPYSYDRYVRDSSFCTRPDRTEPTWIATADTPQCFVGYRCVQRPLRLRD
jgi:hypothetical protein